MAAPGKGAPAMDCTWRRRDGALSVDVRAMCDTRYEVRRVRDKNIWGSEATGDAPVSPTSARRGWGAAPSGRSTGRRPRRCSPRVPRVCSPRSTAAWRRRRPTAARRSRWWSPPRSAPPAWGLEKTRQPPLSWRFSFANASPFSTRSPATVTRRGSKGKDGRPRARSVSRLSAREPEPDGGSTWETLDASFSRKNLRREPSDPARRHSLTRCVGLTERARRLRVFASRRRARTLDARTMTRLVEKWRPSRRSTPTLNKRRLVGCRVC